MGLPPHGSGSQVRVLGEAWPSASTALTEPPSYAPSPLKPTCPPLGARSGIARFCGTPHLRYHPLLEGKVSFLPLRLTTVPSQPHLPWEDQGEQRDLSTFVRGKRVASSGDGENSAAPKPPDLGTGFAATRVGQVPHAVRPAREQGTLPGVWELVPLCQSVSWVSGSEGLCLCPRVSCLLGWCAPRGNSGSGCPTASQSSQRLS